MTTVAETKAGKVEGYEKGGLILFKGIPYAAPPLGDLRWMPPTPVSEWNGIRPAKRYGGISPQIIAEASLLPRGPQLDQSEDCLYLNVWTPGLDDACRPVLVWIHGGGFAGGSGMLYDGAPLVKRGDIVMVSVNYRLGPIGFLNLHEITGGNIPATGNEGLLDQVAALEWVQENIRAFGGDPEQVTIAGESAGGMSVGSLFGLPNARGLFHKAIPQSGACSTALPLEKATQAATHYLELLGIDADDVDGLRSVPTDKLLEASARLVPSGIRNKLGIGTMPLEPVIDGRILPELPLDAVRDGSADGTRILVGSTQDEWTLFSASDLSVRTMSDELLLRRMKRLVPGTDPEPIIDGYRRLLEGGDSQVKPGDLYTAIQTDRAFRMPAIRLAEACSKRRVPAYLYLFTWKCPAFKGRLGACHALELGFIFGSYNLEGADQFFGTGPAADTLAMQMQDAWIAFTRSGDPSCESIGNWPVYGDHMATMLLGEPTELRENPYGDARRIWEGVPDEAVGSF